MKKSIRLATQFALIAGLSLSCLNLSAQQSTPPAAAPATSAIPHRVGLIDMAYIFKHYKKFETLREDLKVEIAQSEAQAKEKADRVQQLQKEMRQFQEGSPEFTQREQQLAKLSAEFETFRRATQREFFKKESQIYHTVYMEVSEAVRKYSEYYKYTLVIRFSREDLDTENPQNLIQGMNRQVVYYRAEDDVTLSVLDYLNRKYTPSAAPAANKNISSAPGTKRN